jgi:hypothetical protein
MLTIFGASATSFTSGTDDENRYHERAELSVRTECVIEGTIDRNGHNSVRNGVHYFGKFFSLLKKTRFDHSPKMTKTLELVHPRGTLKVPVRKLMMKCSLFIDDPVLAGACLS